MASDATDLIYRLEDRPPLAEACLAAVQHVPADDAVGRLFPADGQVVDCRVRRHKVGARVHHAINRRTGTVLPKPKRFGKT